MRILIVEDDQNKLKQLSSFIQKHRPQSDLVFQRAYQSGLAAVLSEAFDLVILDMSMPTYDQSPSETGGRQRAFAGKEILRQMQRKGIKAPVIVVTQFTRFGEGEEAISLTELVRELKGANFPNYRATIYYSPEAANWETELLKCLRSEPQ